MDQKELWKYDLGIELTKLQKGEANVIEALATSFPLCSLSADKRAFLILRTHASLEEDGKISTLGLPPWNDVFPKNISRPGLTLFKYDGLHETSRESTFHLPIGFNYKSVHFEGWTVKMEYDNTSMSFSLHQLFMGHAEKTEEYLTEEFNKLMNPPDPEPEVIKSTLRALPSKLFGKLKYKEQEDEYEGNYKIGKQKFTVTLLNWDEAALKKYIANAEKLLRGGLYDRIIDALSDPMIELYNETWTQDGEQIDKVILLDKISCEGITIYEDGSQVWYFEDGDLFGGHYIQVNVSFEGEIDEPVLAG